MKVKMIVKRNWTNGKPLEHAYINEPLATEQEMRMNQPMNHLYPNETLK